MLFVIFVLLVLVLFALFLGGSLFAQGYLYQQPAEHLPIRAAIGAVLVGGFITAWCAIDRSRPGKYDTFFEFVPYDTRDFAEFEAVRWVLDPATGKLRTDEKGDRIERAVKYKRATGGKAAPFVEAEGGTNQAFKLSTGADMTAAVVVTLDDQPVKFKAEFKKADQAGVPQYAGERRFLEDRGSRYIRTDQLGVVYVPSTGAVAAALLLNFAHFLVWFLVFWLVLRFGLGHALGLTAIFGLTTMLLLMPLLFKQTRAKAPAPAPEPKAAARVEYRSPA